MLRARFLFRGHGHLVIPAAQSCPSIGGVRSRNSMPFNRARDVAARPRPLKRARRVERRLAKRGSCNRARQEAHDAVRLISTILAIRCRSSLGSIRHSPGAIGDGGPAHGTAIRLAEMTSGLSGPAMKLQGNGGGQDRFLRLSDEIRVIRSRAHWQLTAELKRSCFLHAAPPCCTRKQAELRNGIMPFSMATIAFVCHAQFFLVVYLNVFMSWSNQPKKVWVPKRFTIDGIVAQELKVSGHRGGGKPTGIRSSPLRSILPMGVAQVLFVCT